MQSLITICPVVSKKMIEKVNDNDYGHIVKAIAHRRRGTTAFEIVIHQMPNNTQLKFYRPQHSLQGQQNPYHKASCKRPKKNDVKLFIIEENQSIQKKNIKQKTTTSGLQVLGLGQAH